MTDPAETPTLNRLDLTTIALALETHERVHIERAGQDSPPAIAARRTLLKIRGLLELDRRGRR